MDSNLATVQRIKSITPIDGKDFISIANVLGWYVIVRKDHFSVNDLCVYISIDSVLPENNKEFSFMEKHKYRVKTIKMSGVYSQGICFPLSILPGSPDYYQEGDDVTKILGVTKWEKPISLQMRGQVRGNFPSFIRKTDEERLQNIPWVLNEYRLIKWCVTEKLNGCLDKNQKVNLPNNKEISISKLVNDCNNTFFVMGYDTSTDKIVETKILGKWRRENIGGWYEITLSDGKKLKLTGNHRVFVKNHNCYREVKDLDGSEELLLID